MAILIVAAVLFFVQIKKEKNTFELFFNVLRDGPNRSFHGTLRKIPRQVRIIDRV